MQVIAIWPPIQLDRDWCGDYERDPNAGVSDVPT